MFEDIKSYNHFKYQLILTILNSHRNSLQHTSKLLVNIKYPYYCENTNINTYHDSERVNRVKVYERTTLTIISRHILMREYLKKERSNPLQNGKKYLLKYGNSEY